MDTQVGTVTSLTAGEQGFGDGGKDRAGEQACQAVGDWSFSMWGSDGILSHSAPLTVPQPLLTGPQRPCPYRPLPNQQTSFRALLPFSRLHVSLLHVSWPSLSMAPTSAPKTHKTFSYQDLPESSFSLCKPWVPVSGRGSSATSGTRKSPVLTPASSPHLGLVILPLRCVLSPPPDLTVPASPQSYQNIIPKLHLIVQLLQNLLGHHCPKSAHSPVPAATLHTAATKGQADVSAWSDVSQGLAVPSPASVCQMNKGLRAGGSSRAMCSWAPSWAPFHRISSLGLC